MNYYEVLELSEDATPDLIKKRYRELAKKYHPDISKSGSSSEERFKKITEAYNTLSDPEQKKRYDQSLARERDGYNENININDFFSDEIFSRIFKDSRYHGVDIRKNITISLRELALNQHISIKINGEDRVISIDPSMESGTTFLIRGAGEKGKVGYGDLHLTITINPDPIYQKKGLDLFMETNIDLKDLLLGKTITFTHIDGSKKTVKVKPAKKLQTTLKVKNQGITYNGNRGDLYIKLNVVLPDISEKRRKILEKDF